MGKERGMIRWEKKKEIGRRGKGKGEGIERNEDGECEEKGRDGVGQEVGMNRGKKK